MEKLEVPIFQTGKKERVYITNYLESMIMTRPAIYNSNIM
jgi:hypothetical protein